MMQKVSIYLIAFVLSLGCMNVLAQQTSKQSTVTNEQKNDIFYHTIEAGETVYAIATMYGVTAEDIYRLNPDSRNGIKAGAQLKIPQSKHATAAGAKAGNYVYHTILPRETLYSLSLRYDIPATKIIDANPGLSVETFTIGKTIRVPSSAIGTAKAALAPMNKPTITTKDYTVGKKETIFFIAQKFNVTTTELVRINPALQKGAKAGMVIKIPIQSQQQPIAQPAAPKEREVNELLSKPRPVKEVNAINVALLLPFAVGPSTSTQASARFVEYYEGLLLAVDSLKGQGYNINLSVYDTGSGTAQLKSILEEEDLLNANLIIGAVQTEQISPIADFAAKHSINYVIPFTSKNDDVLSNAHVMQINTPQSYLYSNAVKEACSIFGNDNIIFVNTGDREQKDDFIHTLKSEMKQKRVAWKEMHYSSDTFSADIEKLLSRDHRNVVIPLSSSLEAINKLKSTLRVLSDVNSEGKVPYEITMFGYPEWQTYTRDCLDDFYALNVYIYSGFYADNLSPEVHNFYSSYKKWFSKTLINTFPKYGMLGFDTGMYFLQMIHRYGSDFEDDFGHFHYEGLQTGFNFHRVNNWGGFINTNIFIIHYNNSDDVTRTEIR